MIAVRHAEPRDAQAAADLLHRSITELCFLDHRGDADTLAKWLANKRPQNFISWLASADNFCVIAEADRQVVGVGLLHRSGEIRLCYLAPGAQRKGIGKAIYLALEEQAKAWGLRILKLESTVSARQFYEALGFRSAGIAAPGFGISHCHPYEKQLQPMTVALYYSPGSCSLAPHIVLNDIGQPFELRKFSTADRQNYSPEYLAVNPKGRIPALHIDGFILTENPAILAYLGRRFPSASLYPNDGSEAEARCLELLAWSSNTAHVAYAQLLRPERFVPNEAGYPPVKESGRANYERCLTDIDKKLQHQQYAVASQFTVVDPFWLVFYRWGARAGYDMRAKFPAYTAYVERLCARPSVQRALTTEGISVWK